jgi:hypothetical protein
VEQVEAVEEEVEEGVQVQVVFHPYIILLIIILN